MFLDATDESHQIVILLFEEIANSELGFDWYGVYAALFENEHFMPCLLGSLASPWGFFYIPLGPLNCKVRWLNGW